MILRALMTTDLWMLTWTATLAIAFPFLYQPGRLRTAGGVAWAFGNRERPLEVPAWVDRAVRAHHNHVENVVPFAILVLVAHVTGKANDLTALGATIFFWGRLAYAVVYTAGILYLRTAVFFVAWIGAILVLTQLFR